MDPAQATNRHISLPPHREGFFNNGEFVYDPTAAWDDLRSGSVGERPPGAKPEGWIVSYPPKEIKDDWSHQHLAAYGRPIGRHILIDYSGLGPPRGPKIDPSPWRSIFTALLDRLRDADGRRVRLNTLVEEVKKRPDLDAELIEDTMRMAACMGACKVTQDAGGFWYGASDLLKDSFARRDYLSSFSDELLAKSRRIDTLVKHTGTVGTYREELLRSLIRKILPTRYEVGTGFIENCPRQIDVLIWDAGRYAPLFREQDVVVVPGDAVRAIIEVKTTLTTSSLDEALDILYEVMRVDPSYLPVFKGIFAFESDYATDKSIADRMQTFFKATQADGVIERKHMYLGQGVGAVCVPNRHCVLQGYIPPEDEDAYPYPVLCSLNHDGRGDVRTGVFLGQMLRHLDLDPEPKRTLLQMFLPVYNECSIEQINDLFGPSWKPTLAHSRLGAVLDAPGAKTYVMRMEQFKNGEIAPADVGAGLARQFQAAEVGKSGSASTSSAANLAKPGDQEV